MVCTALRNEASINNEVFDQKLQAEITKLEGKNQEYNLHMDQLISARAAAYKVRDNMAVGEVFVTRDYVNHHDHDGKDSRSHGSGPGLLMLLLLLLLLLMVLLLVSLLLLFLLSLLLVLLFRVG
jgi:hypothetical protein